MFSDVLFLILKKIMHSISQDSLILIIMRGFPAVDSYRFGCEDDQNLAEKLARRRNTLPRPYKNLIVYT